MFVPNKVRYLGSFGHIYKQKERENMGKELFDNIPSKVADLLSDVKNGRIDLPDFDLLNLGIYSLPTLKINSKADEEDVADIFVRVNSGIQNLDMTMTVIEIRLQTLHVWIMQQTLTFLMHLRQSMLPDIERSWVKMDISLPVFRMLYRRILNSYLIWNF